MTLLYILYIFTLKSLGSIISTPLWNITDYLFDDLPLFLLFLLRLLFLLFLLLDFLSSYILVFSTYEGIYFIIIDDNDPYIDVLVRCFESNLTGLPPVALIASGGFNRLLEICYELFIYFGFSSDNAHII